jgi:hypothetical protein
MTSQSMHPSHFTRMPVLGLRMRTAVRLLLLLCVLWVILLRDTTSKHCSSYMYSNPIVIVLLVPLFRMMLLCLQRKSDIQIRIIQRFSGKTWLHNLQDTGYFCVQLLYWARGMPCAETFFPEDASLA